MINDNGTDNFHMLLIVLTYEADDKFSFSPSFPRSWTAAALQIQQLVILKSHKKIILMTRWWRWCTRWSFDKLLPGWRCLSRCRPCWWSGPCPCCHCSHYDHEYPKIQTLSKWLLIDWLDSRTLKAWTLQQWCWVVIWPGFIWHHHHHCLHHHY